MKQTFRLLPLCIVFALPVTKVAAQSQHEMNQQAYAAYEKADAELNKVYAKVLAKLDDTGKAKLKTAQRAWVAFRDAQAELDADQMRGGSAAPLLQAGSLNSTTKKRTQELKDFLKNLESN